LKARWADDVLAWPHRSECHFGYLADVAMREVVSAFPRMLVTGGSLSRRMYLIMEAMLSPWVPYTCLPNPLHNEIIPVKTSEVPVLKLELAEDSGTGWRHADNVMATDLNFHWNPCLATMKKRYKIEDLKLFDLIIWCIGIWD